MSNGYDQEMYQELYAIRSRIEYIHEIYQEAYAMRTSLQNIESLLDRIYKETVALRRDLTKEGPSEVSDIESVRRSKKGDEFF